MKRKTLTACLAFAIASPVMAALDTTDTSIILLHQLNEQSSGQLDNNIDQSFVDSAPTGTAQDHDNFGDGASDGPGWGSGAAFQSGLDTVGTGTGLTFDRADGDNTRFDPWLGVSQGNYTNGDSFTLMMRIYATSSADNTTYNLIGHSSNYIQLEGVSSGTALRVDTRLREGAGGGESDFLFDSFGSTGATTAAGGNFSLAPNTWYNLFLIYEANTSITLAADDGTTFQFLRTNDIGDVGASFDTLTNGFTDSGVPWALGAQAYGISPTDSFDGRIESLVIWDKALSDSEADAINLTNIPEPATLGLLSAGVLVVLARRHR